MSFRILVDGEEKARCDEQVTRVSIMTPSGVRSEFGIADEGAIDIVLTKAQPGGPMRLDHLEALRSKQEAERVQGLSSGQLPGEVPKALTDTQGPHSYIATGEEPSETEQRTVTPPPKDLAEGLEATDTDTINARLSAYADSGDADKAISDNPPGSGSGGSSASEPVVAEDATVGEPSIENTDTGYTPDQAPTEQDTTPDNETEANKEFSL